MGLTNRWKIATSFGWVHMWLTNGAAEAASGHPQNDNAQHARFTLLFELEHARAPQQALNELSSVLRSAPGFGFDDMPADDQLQRELARLLEAELESGRIQLSFEQFASVHRERGLLDIELPPLPKGAAPSKEPSFITVRLIDDKGAAVAGRPFQIELPDGSVHRGFTDPDGFGRVRGFTQDGTATILFPDFDELDFKARNNAERAITPIEDTPKPDDEELAEETPDPSDLPLDEQHVVDVVVVGSDKLPIADEEIVLIDSAGREFRAISDEKGMAHFEGLTPGEAQILLATI